MKSSTLSNSTYDRRQAFRLFGLAGAATLVVPRLLRASEATPPAPVPSLAGSEPGFHRFKIGAIEALVLRDGGFAPTLAQGPFAVGEPREKLAAVLHDAFLPETKTEMPFNVMLVKIGADLVMIDAGCGSMYGPAGGQLVGNLVAAGIKPEQITAIILTHLHGDHFGGLIDATTHEPVFKNAKVFIHKNELAFWSSPLPDLSANLASPEMKKGLAGGARAFLDAWKGKWEVISGGEKLFEGVEILEAFGHTPGHIAVQISSGSEQLLNFVDAAHHHALSISHPEWKLAFDSHPDVAVATRKKLFDRAAADRLRVFGGHMPFPCLGHLRTQGNGFEFVIEPSSIS